MDLPDEMHLALLVLGPSLGAPSDGICFMNETEAAHVRAYLDQRVRDAEQVARLANQHKKE